MRIMTIRQPWSWAIIHGGKDVENRSRNIAGQYRGPVAIHAGLANDWDGIETVRSLVGDRFPRAGGHWSRSDWTFGAIIGVVDVDGVIEPHDDPCDFCSPWAIPGNYQLILRNPRPLSEPIPYKGALGLREVPADLLARIEAAL